MKIVYTLALPDGTHVDEYPISGLPPRMGDSLVVNGKRFRVRELQHKVDRKPIHVDTGKASYDLTTSSYVAIVEPEAN